jgi:hypothetical protein
MDPIGLVADEARRRLSGGLRLTGPILAQAGLVSTWKGWGGRPTDTVSRIAEFCGLRTAWIDNVRSWLDAPLRHDSVAHVATAITGLLVLSLGHWAGSWLGEQEATRSLLERAGEDKAARMKVHRQGSEYTVARSAGTGTAVWLGVAVLQELQALTTAIVALGITIAVVAALLSHLWDRHEAADPPPLGESAAITGFSICATALTSLGISLVAPEIRLAGALMYAQPHRRPANDAEL